MQLTALQLAGEVVEWGTMVREVCAFCAVQVNERNVLQGSAINC